MVGFLSDHDKFLTSYKMMKLVNQPIQNGGWLDFQGIQDKIHGTYDIFIFRSINFVDFYA